jgi:hypothetical protein
VKNPSTIHQPIPLTRADDLHPTIPHRCEISGCPDSHSPNPFSSLFHSWRASRTAAALLTFLIASCDPAVLFSTLSSGLRGELEALHAAARGAGEAGALRLECECVQAHVLAAQRGWSA